MAQKLNKEQVEKAVSALFAYLQKRDSDDKSNQLFDDDAFVSLTISLKKTPETGRAKPYRVPIQHSLYEDKAICLFTKDPHQPIRDKLDENPVDGIDKIIGVSKLRKNYRQYEDKRKLLATYDLFLADERILPLLPACLGKKFFDKKKQPAPVNLTRNLNHALERARDSTYFFVNSGPTCMVKVGRTGFAKQQVVENILGSINNIVDHIPKKWKNVQAIFVRTHDSVALPIFNALPGNFRIDTGPSIPTSLTISTPTKSKKRSLAEDGAVEAEIEKKTPAKKTKTTNGKSVKKSSTKPPVSPKLPAAPATASIKKSVKKAPATPATTAKGKKTPLKKSTKKAVKSAKK